MSQFDQLAAPFPPTSISWRVGSTNREKTKGMALAYIDARDVMERLDTVVGPGGWQDRYEIHGARTICTLSLRIGDEWVAKSDGAGDTDVEAEKGALSDAFKRAAVKWGVGRYLYALDAPWVEIEAFGKSFRIAKHEYARLARVLPGVPVAKHEPEDNGNPFDGPADNPHDPVTEARAYVAISKTAAHNAETLADLEEWWRREAPRRREYGLTKQQIADLQQAAADRKRELMRDADLTMAG